jgi:O-antigen/teichoic acid export membrane protein
MGIDNGLRNLLTIAISEKDAIKAKTLISTSYLLIAIISFFIFLLCLLLFPVVDWNNFLNVREDLVSKQSLLICMLITVSGVILVLFFRTISSVIYALQLSSINNLLVFLVSLGMVLYLIFVEPSESNEDNLKNISIAHVLISILPYIFASLYVFTSTWIKHCRPSYRFAKKDAAKSVFKLGMTFFFIQILYMIITVSDQWFISKFFSPEKCVDYQVYHRIFFLFSTLFMLGLTPLWSAVTKAHAEKNYSWIIKMQKILYVIAILISIVQIAIIPILQPIIDIWLGEKSIQINFTTSAYFIFYSVVFVWIGAQSTIVGGLGVLKVQIIGYLFAVIFKIVSIVFLSNYTEQWAVVVLLTAIGLLPFCIYQPVFVRKLLNELNQKKLNDTMISYNGEKRHYE